VPQSINSLHWLSAMPQRSAELLPRTYYSSRSPPPIPTDAESSGGCDTDTGRVQRAIDPIVGNGSVGGAGAAISWQGRQVGTKITSGAIKAIRRFLSAASPRVCVTGGSRFDTDRYHKLPNVLHYSACYFHFPWDLTLDT
jgi:hypothetical protein